jgi:hypothetical protein
MQMFTFKQQQLKILLFICYNWIYACKIRFPTHSQFTNCYQQS